jgi:hypothetical protein
MPQPFAWAGFSGAIDACNENRTLAERLRRVLASRNMARKSSTSFQAGDR